MAVKATSSVTLMMVSDGAKGSDGKGISTIIHHYLVTNVTTGVTINTTGWKTSPSSVTTTNKYLWYYQTINYTTGSPTNTTPAIIGVYGDTGGKGETGKGIKSVTPEYYLSTSNTTQTGGSWKATQDAWVSGKYYWTRDSINWNDGSTTTTTPTLATGLNNANSTANNAQTIANQTASKFQWIVKSGNSATDFTLTDRTAQLVADHINLNGLVTFKGLDSNTQNIINKKANQSIIDNWAKDSVVNGETVINGGYIKTNTIKTDQLAVDDIFATGSAAMNIINAQEINANRITSGLLSAERINAYGLSILNKTTNQQTFNISNNGEVTIRGSVSSGNYVEGKTGWAINNNGTAEFNDIVARGSVITNDGGIASSGGVRFWAGGSYNERESAPWIVYSDGSMKATQGEFSGVFSGTVDIGNIKIADPSSTAGGDALLTIQNGQNGIKRVQLTDSSASRFAQDIIIADDHDADKISLKQDGTAVIHTGINVGNNVILNGKSLFMNNNELTTTDDGVSYLFKSHVTLGTSVGPANLIVNGNANANDVTVNEHLYFGSNVKITKVSNGVNIDVIK